VVIPLPVSKPIPMLPLPVVTLNKAAELKNCNDLIKELVALLEYEEALTVDPRSQQRMSAKLIELGLWPSR